MAWGWAQNFYSYNRKCQSWVSFTWTSGNENVSYSVTGYARSGDGSGYYYASDFGVQVKLFYRVDGGGWTELGSTTTVLDYGNNVGNLTRGVTIPRTTSARSVEFACDAVSTTGDWPTATAYLSDSMGALPSYAVTYSANKPGGASGDVGNMPASQTKWHGLTLGLASTQPTLDLHLFRGWNTAADGGGTAYAPGAGYAADAPLTLHAQWELAYSYPQISGLTVIRCDGGGDPGEDGTHAKVSFAWSVDATADGGTNRGKRHVIAAAEAGGSSWTTLKTTSVSTTGGNVSVIVGGSLATTKSYLIRVALTDTHLIGGAECTTTAYSVLSQAFVWVSANPNHGLAIGKQATLADTLDIGLATRIGDLIQAGGAVELDAASRAAWHGALAPDVLYDSPAGTEGAVALAATAAGYSHMRIYYRQNDGYVSSVDVHQPNGKTACLVSFYPGATTYVHFKIVRINGSQIVVAGYARAALSASGASNTDTVNQQAITRVEAW